MLKETPSPIDPEKAALLLREIAKTEEARVIPQIRFSPSGSDAHPWAASVLKVREGEESGYLEWLVEKGYLTRETFDVIVVCPLCQSADIAAHEKCFNCAGAFVRKEALLHHYRCSFVAAEKDFLKPSGRVCPKCVRPLREIGVDFDIPGEYYLCTACWEKFPEDALKGKCRSCRASFPMEEARSKTLFAYSLTSEGAQAAEKGRRGP
ncbi:MAG: hypothetical protein U1F57_01275 [bacterium]